ncbi:hypothetical protein B8W95_13945, partial [Staphylococcus pasteuri]
PAHPVVCLAFDDFGCDLGALRSGDRGLHQEPEAALAPTEKEARHGRLAGPHPPGGSRHRRPLPLAHEHAIHA